MARPGASPRRSQRFQIDGDGELIGGLFCAYCGSLNEPDTPACQSCGQYIADQGPDLRSRLQRISRRASHAGSTAHDLSGAELIGGAAYASSLSLFVEIALGMVSWIRCRVGLRAYPADEEANEPDVQPAPWLIVETPCDEADEADEPDEPGKFDQSDALIGRETWRVTALFFAFFLFGILVIQLQHR